jgi:HEAT repeat protein
MRRLLLIALLLLAAGCSRSTDHWLGQLKDSDVIKRRQAVRELALRTGDAGRIVPALTEVLRDENPYVRHDAATTLGLFGSKARSAVPALETVRKDRDANVRRAAAAAVKQIAPDAVANARK